MPCNLKIRVLVTKQGQISFIYRCRARAGGLLSEDSPFLDVVREGLKLALPSAEVVHPRVQPAHGAALLIQDRLFGRVAAGGNVGEGAEVGGLFRTPERPRHHHHRRTPSSQGECGRNL